MFTLSDKTNEGDRVLSEILINITLSSNLLNLEMGKYAIALVKKEKK